MRGYCKLHPPLASKHKKVTPAAERILGRESVVQADFTTPQVLLGPKKKVARFPPNPGQFLLIVL